jgi:uncharacterized protein
MTFGEAEARMGGWGLRAALRVIAAVVTVLAVAGIALWYFIPAPPSTITIAAGLPGGSFEHLGLRYQERLARHHVTAKIRLTKGSVDSANLLHDPKSGIDAALLLGTAIGNVDASGLVSLGRITYSPIWFFYRGHEPIENLSQLKGKRFATTAVGGRIITEILAGYDVTPQNTTFLTLAAADAAKALRNGEADVISFSQEVNTPNVQSLLRDPSVHLMNVAQAAAVTQLFPSISHLVLSQGVIDLGKNIPASDLNLIALTNAVIARANLHPELIYLLAQTMKEEHNHSGIFHRVGDFPTQTDPDLPMAEEAVDFYRNGPPLLQRYLPFWMINYAKRVAAIVVAAIAVVIPLFTYAPKIYDWLLRSQLKRLYRRLRAVENAMQRDLSASEALALQNELDSINRSARILPPRHSDLFFPLIMHVDSVRARLASRLIALHGERAA